MNKEFMYILKNCNYNIVLESTEIIASSLASILDSEDLEPIMNLLLNVSLKNKDEAIDNLKHISRLKINLDNILIDEIKKEIEGIEARKEELLKDLESDKVKYNKEYRRLDNRRKVLLDITNKFYIAYIKTKQQKNT